MYPVKIITSSQQSSCRAEKALRIHSIDYVGELRLHNDVGSFISRRTYFESQFFEVFTRGKVFLVKYEMIVGIVCTICRIFRSCTDVATAL